MLTPKNLFRTPHKPIHRGLLVVVVLLSIALSPGVSAQDDEPSEHIVRFGETLSQIAESYQVSLSEVMLHNGIDDPDAIHVGQSLLIPTVEPDTSEESGSASESSQTPEGTNLETTGDEPEAGPREETGSIVDAGNMDEPTVRQSISTTSLNPIYTVEAGDTIGWIALRYGTSLPSLLAVNNLSPGPSIKVGQKLILPATREELVDKPEPDLYTVQEGESVGLIARTLDVDVNTLMAANNLSDGDFIHPGQTLAIPQEPVETNAPAVGPTRSGFHYHTVRAGDTLSTLAEQYNSTPQAIVRYNDLPDTETVYSGLEIRIPYGPPALDRRLPPTPRSGTEVIISISRQRCWVMRGVKVLYEWKCSTGQGEWVTRTGTFTIKTKMEMAQSSAYRLDMPYWLGLYDVGEFENGIHGIPIEWSTGEKLWDELVGQPATFGCAMLLDEDARRLYELAYIGMPVHIVD